MDPAGPYPPTSPEPPQYPSPPQLPPTSSYPYYAAPAPPKPDHTLAIVISVIVALVLIIGFALAATFFLRSARAPISPSMEITNFQLVDQRSCLITQGGNVYVTFDLVNTGGNGFAQVAFTIDSVTEATNNFYVQGGSQIHVSEPVYVSDCNGHSFGAQVVSEWSG